MINQEIVVEQSRKLEQLMIRIALQDQEPLNFTEAMDICHWLGRKVRIKGSSWYLRGAKKGHRYALWVNDGDKEYVTEVEHVKEVWETF